MSVLVIAEHDGSALKPATLHAVTAASEVAKAAGGDVHLLVAGKDCRAVAEAAAQIEGIAKVLLADDPAYDHGLAENWAPLIVKLAAGYSHVLAPATTSGKNLMPRVAALLDVMQISDISAVESRRHLRAPDLCRQRAGDGAVEGPGQDHHGARHRLRAGGGDRRQRRDRGGRDAPARPE